jgi:16S rRNA (adenine(1408)-N(1))-methyltransferase
METIRGKTSLDLDLTELNARLANYNRISLDLGTGDGRFAHSLAERNPHHFIMGLDSCRENLREYSRVRLPNLLFIIANAKSMPRELHGRISHLTVNFPWGSLLDGLLNADSSLMRGLESAAGSFALFDIHLNGGALAERGCHLDDGAERIYKNLACRGWQVHEPVSMGMNELHTFPTTWARRLVHGRDPRAIRISGCIR